MAHVIGYSLDVVTKMRCPKCKSGDVVKSGSYRMTCYNCGNNDLVAKFLEIGDKIKRDDIGIYLCDDKELTYEGVMQVNAPKVHPLLNPESTHYNMFDDKESIEILEAIMTTTELMAWCRGNVYKYRLRIGNKDNASKEVKKIQTYEAYYRYLKEKLDD